ncbi:MAG: DNA-binding domain-containing protein [Pseudomonadota bacterium]
MSERDFQNLQRDFAAHLRDPVQVAAPDGIEDRRMAIYRELIYNNIEGFISGGFPVLRKLYEDDAWHDLIRQFLVHHRCQSPYFLKISEEFLQFLSGDAFQPREIDPPFMAELAHYEWVELALSVAPDETPPAGLDPNGDLMTGAPCLSPLAWHLVYQWPVQQLGPDYRPQTPPDTPTHLVVYRDRRDEVRFVSVAPMTSALLQLVEAHPGASGGDLCLALAEHLEHPEPAQLQRAGVEALEALREKGILLGTHPARDPETV